MHFRLKLFGAVIHVRLIQVYCSYFVPDQEMQTRMNGWMDTFSGFLLQNVTFKDELLAVSL